MKHMDTKITGKSHRLIVLGVMAIVALGLLGWGLNARVTGQVIGISFLVLIPAAFLSGLLSFLSPCSLPILPAYFAYSFQSNKKNIIVMTMAFFLGLATTMTLLGASVTVVGRILVQNMATLTFIGGILIIIFGFLSVFGKGFTGVQFQDRPNKSIGGTYLYGASFAIGWTACIGPILGAILTLLSTQGLGILQGAFLSFVYAMGLGLPLIFLSAFFSRLGNGSPFWRFIRGKGFDVKLFGSSLSFHTTSLISGLLLITIGVMLITGRLTQLTQLGLESPISAWVVEMDEKIRVLFGLR